MTDQHSTPGVKPLSEMTFNEMLHVSFKSDDTEEWLDVHFTRPVGLFFALGWMRLNIHPNVVTIISIFLGVAAGVMFYHTDLTHNIIGVVLLMLANFCDSTDGQMARLTGKKTLLGRVLDGFAGDVWFVAIYIAIALRLTIMPMPGTDIPWGYLVWMLCIVAGIFCHSPQAALADYYRQVHLWMLKGKAGSELDNYQQQRHIYETVPADLPLFQRMLSKAFHYNYANYCRSQEQQTPWFQRLYAMLTQRYGDVECVPEQLREEFLKGSRPLMKYTNLLTFNTRAICLYVACLSNIPWLFPVFEMVVLTCLYIHMHKQHETLCHDICEKYFPQQTQE